MPRQPRRAIRGSSDQRRERWAWSARRRKRIVDEASAPAPPPQPHGADGKTRPARPGAVATAEFPETDLASAERRVRDGEGIVERQRELIFDLRRHGRSSDEAEKLLRTFQDVLMEYRKNLAMLQIRHRRGL
jgi:hypothetical protein